MSEAQQRDRSPAFPVVPLKDALERLAAFQDHFKRTPARPEKVGEAWDIKTKSYADRIAAALRYFGLLDYQGQPGARLVAISDEGRKYLQAQQEDTKRNLIKAAALRPRQIQKFWELWGADRPKDAACLDDLTMHHGFGLAGARDFLKVYDATIGFAGLGKPDKLIDKPSTSDSSHEGGSEREKPEIEVGDLIQAEIDGTFALEKPDRVRAIQEHEGRQWVFVETSEAGIPMEQAALIEKGAAEAKPHGVAPTLPLKTPATAGREDIVQGEKEWLRGPLSREVSYRLIVSGDLGPKEIGKLIKVLKAQQSILSDDDEGEDPVE